MKVVWLILLKLQGSLKQCSTGFGVNFLFVKSLYNKRGCLTHHCFCLNHHFQHSPGDRETKDNWWAGAEWQNLKWLDPTGHSYVTLKIWHIYQSWLSPLKKLQIIGNKSVRIWWLKFNHPHSESRLFLNKSCKWMRQDVRHRNGIEPLANFQNKRPCFDLWLCCWNSPRVMWSYEKDERKSEIQCHQKLMS